MLEKSLVEAGAARDVASDSVRRLEPIATAARESERGMYFARRMNHIFGKSVRRLHALAVGSYAEVV